MKILQRHPPVMALQNRPAPGSPICVVSGICREADERLTEKEKEGKQTEVKHKQFENAL
jgi:hypothetical protein